MQMLTKIKKLLSKPITIVPLVIICCLVSMAAGRVNGLFNNVDAQGGYTLNGTAGTSGYALCTSTGAKFDQACSLTGSTVYYQHVIFNGITQTQEPALGVTASFTCSDNSGVDTLCDLAGTGTAGTYAYPSSVTADSKGRVTSITNGLAPYPIPAATAVVNGFYKTSSITVSGNGETLYEEDFSTGALGNNTTTVVTLPHSIPNLIWSITCSDNSSRVQSGGAQAVGANVSGQSAPFSSIQVLSPASGESAYCHVVGD